MIRWQKMSHPRREASCCCSIKTAPIKNASRGWRTIGRNYAAVIETSKGSPRGSKSGPIFGNLYTMARWMCTQDSPLVRKGIPPVSPQPFPLVNERLASVQTYKRSKECKKKEGLSREEDEGQDAKGRIARVYFWGKRKASNEPGR